MFETSSRIHTFMYSSLLTVILICTTVHMASFVSDRLDPTGAESLILVSAIVSSMLAPPASFLLAFSSHRLIKVQEKLRDLATTDPLTGLLNRRAFAAHYDKEHARFARTGEHMSLVVFDLDHFKALNTQHGHPGGDEALRALADCLRRTMRFGTDEVARWGGEEFVVLLTNTNRDSAIRAAIRYSKAIEMLEIDYRGAEINITACFGVVVCLRNESLEDAVGRADNCLKDAKSKGPNNVFAVAPENGIHTASQAA